MTDRVAQSECKRNTMLTTYRGCWCSNRSMIGGCDLRMNEGANVHISYRDRNNYWSEHGSILPTMTNYIKKGICLYN